MLDAVLLIFGNIKLDTEEYNKIPLNALSTTLYCTVMWRSQLAATTTTNLATYSHQHETKYKNKTWSSRFTPHTVLLLICHHYWVIIVVVITQGVNILFPAILFLSTFSALSSKSRKIRRQEEERPFTSYLKYRAAVCFMYKKQDPPFVLWKFTRREFQSSADKIF